MDGSQSDSTAGFNSVRCRPCLSHHPHHCRIHTLWNHPFWKYGLQQGRASWPEVWSNSKNWRAQKTSCWWYLPTASKMPSIKSHGCPKSIDHCPLSGIVISGNKPLDESVLKYINDNQIPVVRTDLDTYEAVIKISKIEVKINQNTPWKVQKTIKLIEENVDLEYIIQSKTLNQVISTTFLPCFTLPSSSSFSLALILLPSKNWGSFAIW